MGIFGQMSEYFFGNYDTSLRKIGGSSYQAGSGVHDISNDGEIQALTSSRK